VGNVAAGRSGFAEGRFNIAQQTNSRLSHPLVVAPKGALPLGGPRHLESLGHCGGPTSRLGRGAGAPTSWEIGAGRFERSLSERGGASRRQANPSVLVWLECVTHRPLAHLSQLRPSPMSRRSLKMPRIPRRTQSAESSPISCGVRLTEYLIGVRSPAMREGEFRLVPAERQSNRPHSSFPTTQAHHPANSRPSCVAAPSKRKSSTGSIRSQWSIWNSRENWTIDFYATRCRISASLEP